MEIKGRVRSGLHPLASWRGSGSVDLNRRIDRDVSEYAVKTLLDPAKREFCGLFADPLGIGESGGEVSAAARPSECAVETYDRDIFRHLVPEIGETSKKLVGEIVVDAKETGWRRASRHEAADRSADCLILRLPRLSGEGKYRVFSKRQAEIG